MARSLFSDGFNSMAHMLCGHAAYYLSSHAVALFMLYQLDGDTNQFIDIAEFLVGYNLPQLMSFFLR